MCPIISTYDDMEWRGSTAATQLDIDTTYPVLNEDDLEFLFSVRRRVTTYTGPLIKVRRVSDGVTQDFHVVSAISSFLGTSEGRIVTWYDQSGNENHVEQAASSSQPTFNGSTDLTSDTPFAVNNDATEDTYLSSGTSASHRSVFAAVRVTSSTEVFGGLLSQLSTESLILRQSGSSALWDTFNYSSDWNVNKVSTRTYVHGNWHVFSTFRASLANFNDTLLLTNGSFITSRTWDGDVSEIFAYNADVSSNRSAIESEMMNHFGIS